jgi:hypothetical protein
MMSVVVEVPGYYVCNLTLHDVGVEEEVLQKRQDTVANYLTRVVSKLCT